MHPNVVYTLDVGNGLAGPATQEGTDMDSTMDFDGGMDFGAGNSLVGLVYGPNDTDAATPWDDMDNDGDTMTDAEADADTLANAGWGTDEDYGYFGGDDW